VECFRDLAGDDADISDRQPRLAGEPLLESFALDVRHHVVEDFVSSARVVERDDVRVRQSRGDLDLLEEPRRRERESGLQDLDGDAAVVLEISGEIDRCHPTASELALERVTPGEGGTETVQKVRHATVPASI